MKFSRPFIAHCIFIVGLFFTLIGIVFLLGNLANISQKRLFLSFLFGVIGAGSAFFALSLNKRAVYLFFGSFFIMVGLFLFLSALHIFPFSIRETWPLAVVFSGLALAPVGWRKYGRFHPVFMVPAITFVILGGVLLMFSFRIVSFNFRQFVLNWWPVFLILAGIMLLLIALSNKGIERKGGEGKT
ncbi:MAG: DUF5668 domain-containing protein [Treponema sp.]|jgi:hypothetical protein|nr:DUF5668 domain-containing protein [Treponema sp.]